MARRPRTPVLFVHHRSELGGAPASLSYLIRELDHERVRGAHLLPAGPGGRALPRVGRARPHGRRLGLHAHLGLHLPRPALAAVRARARAAPAARPAVPDARSRRHRFELVHFNDSPLIPAAWLARHEGLPVVWHLRSALPDGGRDRRSAFVRAAIRRLATTSIAINHDVAERLRGRLDRRPELRRPRAVPPRRPGGGEARARPARLARPSSRTSASSTRRRASASSSRPPPCCAIAGSTRAT